MPEASLFDDLYGQSIVADGSSLTRRISVGDFATSSSVDAMGLPEGLDGWWKAYLRGIRPTPATSNGRTLKTIDVFSGIGGLALGFRQAADECGFRTRSVVAVDQDPDALAVYRNNHRTDLLLTESASMLVNYQLSGNADDATFFGPPTAATKLAHLRGSIDAILAGPPCQGHSNLNNYSRRIDDRNQLYLTVPAMAVALDVPLVVIENVPGVVHDHHSVVSTTISLLKTSGYEVTHGVLDASAMGWPQTRKRFFLVASRLGRPIDLRTVADSLSTARPFSVSWALEDLPVGSREPFMDLLPVLSDDNRRRVEYLFDNDLHELPNDQRPECHQNGTSYRSVYGRMRADKPAPTITGGFLSPGRGRFTHPTEPRALTPREAARIQGFPDTYSFALPQGEPGRTHLARWIGNAVPMPLGFAAGLALLLPIQQY
jgi:DNA (cytosine-5)-methyltransferase 1